MPELKTLIANKLAAFESVGLEDVNKQAALIRRVDKKYVVRPDQLPQLLDLWKSSHWALEIQELRIASYFTIEGSKSVSKKIDLIAEYRLGKVQTATYHRFSAGSEFNTKIKTIDIGIRLLVLNNIQDFLDPADATKHAGFWRARFKIGYRINKKWEGYISTEPIMEFGANSFVDNWRNTVGLKHKFSPNTKINVFYIYRPDYAKASYNRIFHVLGFSLDFKVKPKNKG